MNTTLYILCGLPGAGKTTYAKSLAKDKNAKLFSLDTLMNEKYSDMHECDLGIREYATKYDLLPQIEELLESEQSVILDFGFYKRSERERYRKLAKLYSVESETHFVTAKYKTLLERVTKRNSEDSNVHHIDKEILDVLIERFEEPQYDEQHIKINTD